MNTLRATSISIIVFCCLACCCVRNNNSTHLYKKNVPFEISLPSNLGEGHQWFLYDTVSFKIIDHSAIPNPKHNESTDIEQFKLIASKKGVYRLTFYYLRPFDEKKDTANSKKTSLLIRVK